MNREEKVKEYYRNCFPSNIEYSSKVRDENGNKNDLYFRELTIQLYNLWNNEVNQNITFSEETKKYLKIENRQLDYLFNDIFKLFHRVCVFEETPTGGVKSINPIFRAEYNIEKCFSNIDFHSLFISTLIENSQYNEAIAVKNYLLTRINTIITNSKQLFGISLLKSPLAGYFTNYISSLKEAINIDEIKLSIELEEPQQEKQPIKEEPKQDKSIILTEINDHHSGKNICHEYEHVLKRFNEIPKHSKFILFNANNRKYAVYSATVSYVFSSKTKGKYNDTDEVFNIDGDPYFKTFTDAYEKGEEDFKADYVNSNLYISNTEKLVSDIHHAVYHNKFGGLYGWNNVVSLVIDEISHKIIKEYGYYSGMLSGAKEFIKKHPTIFKDVDKCNHSETKKEPQQEKHEIILSKLNDYKFNELEKVGKLDLKIVKHICTESIPYKVAYLDYLGFIKHLGSYTTTKVEIHKILSEILDTTQRSIKGNINVLNPISKEDKTRYTAHEHNKNIEKHYQLLK